MGLLIFLSISSVSLSAYTAILIGCILVGLWTAGKAEKLFGTKDASVIVIDEIAGILLTYYMVPASFFAVVAGFLWFRLFDIVKPLPWLEQLPGSWGVMTDDLCAGLLAHGCLLLSLWLFGF